MAVRFLADRGVDVLARNVRIGRGEIDIVAREGPVVIAVEVRSRWLGDPVFAFDDAKYRQVCALARRLDPPCRRVDLIAVRFHPEGVDIRWIPAIH